MLEGEEFMVLDVQVIGMIEKFEGKNSLMIDYLAACNQKMLTSPWIKERMSLFSDICEGTVMAINNRISARLFLQIREEKDQEWCTPLTNRTHRRPSTLTPNHSSTPDRSGMGRSPDER
jgi:hypothetical protein